MKLLPLIVLFLSSPSRDPRSEKEKNILLIKVRTLLINSTIFALTLAVSWLEPKEDWGALPHPTVSRKNNVSK